MGSYSELELWIVYGYVPLGSLKLMVLDDFVDSGIPLSVTFHVGPELRGKPVSVNVTVYVTCENVTGINLAEPATLTEPEFGEGVYVESELVIENGYVPFVSVN